MALLDRYLPKKEFNSYEDFHKNFDINIPSNFNFAYDVMDELAKEKGDARAFQWCDEKGAEALFTYNEIRELTNKAANVLQKAGIGKGDPVMLILKRRWEYWPVILALHKLGAIAIPATHLLTTKDIIYRCDAADIKGIICINDIDLMNRIDEADSAIKQKLAYKAFIQSVSKDDTAKQTWTNFTSLFNAANGDFTRPEKTNTNDDIMLLYFTSGTTGMPKMVRHDFTYPLGHIATAKYWHNVVPDGLHFTIADTGWAKSAWGSLYGQWFCGAGIFVYDYDRFDPPSLLSIMSKYKLTSFCAPPTIYRFFIKEDLKKYDFSSLKTCTVAGEPLNPEIFDRFLEGTGIKLRECYGQTELTVTLCTWPWLNPKPGSMGKPAPGYDIDLLLEDGTPCAMGDEGEIVVRTSKRKPWGMFGGYYRDDNLTNNVWHDDVYYTGDVAWKDEDGYFWFVGRNDDVIKSSGYRIGPFEIESALMEHPAVLECAITGVPDEDRGTIVKATVVLAKNYSASKELEKELQEHVKKTTAPYKYPRIVEFVSELPKTISGKIRRTEIRQTDKGKMT